jgi:hypothetical protein
LLRALVDYFGVKVVIVVAAAAARAIDCRDDIGAAARRVDGARARRAAPVCNVARRQLRGELVGIRRLVGARNRPGGAIRFEKRKHRRRVYWARHSLCALLRAHVLGRQPRPSVVAVVALRRCDLLVRQAANRGRARRRRNRCRMRNAQQPNDANGCHDYQHVYAKKKSTPFKIN